MTTGRELSSFKKYEYLKIKMIDLIREYNQNIISQLRLIQNCFLLIKAAAGARPKNLQFFNGSG